MGKKLVILEINYICKAITNHAETDNHSKHTLSTKTSIQIEDNESLTLA